MQPRRLCRRAAPGSPRATGGFTVVELLVVVSIILALMALIGAAVAAATANGKEAATRATIGKLDTILQAQLARYGSRYVDTSSPGDMTKAVYRAWKIRREMITGDMVDRWSDVDLMVADNPTGDDEDATFTSAPQRSYIATRQNGGTPSSTYAGAECLFMIITQGGFADCLDCNALKNVRRGDKDNDGYFETTAISSFGTSGRTRSATSSGRRASKSRSTARHTSPATGPPSRPSPAPPRPRSACGR